MPEPFDFLAMFLLFIVAVFCLPPIRILPSSQQCSNKVDGLAMIDGEKAGLEPGKRKNLGIFRRDSW
ncbi:hypothetical protein K457DRAFT_133415 [Linnemannia elongata AG-77]|uniref:Uncharacterized protein n=1 Tax=Linnemannia elongata AG-77 TaxID=1314771 RepID=A0A197KDA5_9FUNG|nr:hypothetical protein K457DRAFT_133415 [Linnemannia elongata AG-77]